MAGEVLTPERGRDVFMCPRCSVVSQQEWYAIQYVSGIIVTWMGNNKDYLAVNRCRNCGELSFWMGARLIWPATSDAPAPNADMPEEVQRFYEEASATLPHSPRAAASLLRLALETLLHSLGEKGSLDAMIGALVKRGVPEPIQQAMDAVRIHGGYAVHEAGSILLEDKAETAVMLFRLVNWIVQDRITRPKESAAVFSALPPTKRAAIEKRDSGGSGA